MFVRVYVCVHMHKENGCVNVCVCVFSLLLFPLKCKSYPTVCLSVCLELDKQLVAHSFPGQNTPGIIGVNKTFNTKIKGDLIFQFLVTSKRSSYLTFGKRMTLYVGRKSIINFIYFNHSIAACLSYFDITYICKSIKQDFMTRVKGNLNLSGLFGYNY